MPKMNALANRDLLKAYHLVEAFNAAESYLPADVAKKAKVSLETEVKYLISEAVTALQTLEENK